MGAGSREPAGSAALPWPAAPAAAASRTAAASAARRAMVAVELDFLPRHVHIHGDDTAIAPRGPALASCMHACGPAGGL